VPASLPARLRKPRCERPPAPGLFSIAVPELPKGVGFGRRSFCEAMRQSGCGAVPMAGDTCYCHQPEFGANFSAVFDRLVGNCQPPALRNRCGRFLTQVPFSFVRSRHAQSCAGQRGFFFDPSLPSGMFWLSGWRTRHSRAPRTRSPVRPPWRGFFCCGPQCYCLFEAPACIA